MEKGIKLIGSKFTRLEASRNPDFSGKVSMTNEIKILSIDFVKESKENVKMNYSYKIEYSGLGHVYLEGSLFMTSDPKTLKNIVKTFEDKDFESTEQIAVTNLIVQKASIKAMQLEDEFGLPVHVRIPAISIKK